MYVVLRPLNYRYVRFSDIPSLVIEHALNRNSVEVVSFTPANIKLVGNKLMDEVIHYGSIVRIMQIMSLWGSLMLSSSSNTLVQKLKQNTKKSRTLNNTFYYET